MNNRWLVSLALLPAALARGGEILGQSNWKNFVPSQPEVTAVTVDGRACLRIENTNDVPLTVHVTNIVSPPISARFYAFEGDLKYQGVQSPGYLEMWSQFPSGPYFSRTLVESGPMGKISGSSGWRKFLLPFDRQGSTNPPARLEINLVLPAAGTVWIGPCRLEQFPKAPSLDALLGAVNNPGQWWSARDAGRIGGLGGGILGGLAGILGSLAGCLGSKGKGRLFFLTSFGGLALAGLGGLIAGLAAVTTAQPWHVYYPLLVGGAVLFFVCGSAVLGLRRIYLEYELRRMAAGDA